MALQRLEVEKEDRGDDELEVEGSMKRARPRGRGV